MSEVFVFDPFEHALTDTVDIFLRFGTEEDNRVGIFDIDFRSNNIHLGLGHFVGIFIFQNTVFGDLLFQCKRARFLLYNIG